MSANVIRTTRLPASLVPTAVAVAVTVPAAVALIVVYYLVGGRSARSTTWPTPSSGCSARCWPLRPPVSGSTAAAVAAAGAGGALMVVGSWLVITGRSDGSSPAWCPRSARRWSGRGCSPYRPCGPQTRHAAPRSDPPGFGVRGRDAAGRPRRPRILARSDTWEDLRWLGSPASSAGSAPTSATPSGAPGWRAWSGASDRVDQVQDPVSLE